MALSCLVVAKCLCKLINIEQKANYLCFCFNNVVYLSFDMSLYTCYSLND